jgi:phage N-6-adenine-methyltransferase
VALNTIVFSSSRSDWSTPQPLFDRLDKEFRFTLDVCADANNAKCARYYDVARDGLGQPWTGVVWMNPPYGRAIERWLQRAYESTRLGACTKCVCLLPVRSDTKWWHDYVMKSSEIRFLTRRLSFDVGGVKSGNKSTCPVAIVVFGGRSEMPILSAMRV